MYPAVVDTCKNSDKLCIYVKNLPLFEGFLDKSVGLPHNKIQALRK